MFASKRDNGIQFSTSITNYSSESCFLNENCINVYQGVYEKDKWSKINYTPASVYFLQEKASIEREELLTAIATGIAASNAGYSTVSGYGYVNGSRYTYKADVYSPAADNYNGIFIVDEKRGTDYKVVFEMSPMEQFIFYFTRSDKDEILNPCVGVDYVEESYYEGDLYYRGSYASKDTPYEKYGKCWLGIEDDLFVTLVLYFGTESRWTTPKNLCNCFEIPDELKPFVSDYKINVFEIAWLDDETLKMLSVLTGDNTLEKEVFLCAMLFKES